MNTKDKILEGARILLNEVGIKATTVRKICDSLGIGLGSFTYFFSSKKAMLFELYQQMTGEIERVVQAIPVENYNITFFLEAHWQISGIQLKYKFFYVNLVEILKSHPAIQEDYSKTSQLQSEFALHLLQLYMDKGIFKKNISPSLITRMGKVGQILNTFWIVDAELNSDLTTHKMLIYYMRICCGGLEEFLTPRSLKEYQKYFDELENSG